MQAAVYAVSGRRDVLRAVLNAAPLAYPFPSHQHPFPSQHAWLALALFRTLVFPPPVLPSGHAVLRDATQAPPAFCSTAGSYSLPWPVFSVSFP